MPDLSLWKEQQIRRMKRDLDRLFAEFFREFRSPLFPEVFGETPIVEFAEKDDAVVVRAELPGFEPEDLDLSVSDDFLVLQGKRRDEASRETSFRRSESFTNRLRLPCKIRPDEVEASFTGNTLHIVLPKCRPAGFRKVRIRSDRG